MVGGRMVTEKRDYIIRTYDEYNSIDEIENLILRENNEEWSHFTERCGNS